MIEVALFLAIVIALYAFLWSLDHYRGPTYDFDPDDSGKPLELEQPIEMDEAA